METRGAAEIVVLSATLVITIILGIIGNMLVIIALLKFERLRRTLSNLLLLNLAVSDFIQSSLVMPYHLATVISVHIISANGPLCVFGGIITYPFQLNSTLTLIMLAADRYIALSDPLRYRARVTLNTIRAMVAYTWTQAIGFTIMPIFLAKMGFDELSLDCGIIWEDTPLWFSTLSMLTNIILPFVFLTFMSFKVLLIARRQQKKIKEESSLHERGRKSAKGREARATSAILLVIFVFLISWSPFLLTRALRVLGVNLPHIYYTASVWILHTNSVMNIVIYFLRRQELRNAFIAIITRTGINRIQPSFITNSYRNSARVKRYSLAYNTENSLASPAD